MTNTEQLREYQRGFDDGYFEGRADSDRDLEVKLARLERALTRIASHESGTWGLIASDALRGRDRAGR